MAAKPLLAVALGAALTAPALLASEPPSESPADSPGATVTGEPAPKRRVVCRGATKTVGSRIRTPRRCRTEEQWADEDERSNRLPIGAQITEGQNDGRAPVQPR